MSKNNIALLAHHPLVLFGACALLAVSFVALGVGKHEEPRLPKLQLAGSSEMSVPTVASPFAFDHLDLECQMSHTRIDKPHVHHAPPPPSANETAETASADPVTSTGTAPTAVLENERLRYDIQKSAQDVANNITTYFATYSDRAVARLMIEVAEQHGDAAQLAGRLDGQLQFLALLRQWPDGTWDWLNQVTCDELWVSA